MTIQDFLVIIVAIFAALFSLSEALAQIPSIKANSVFQLIHGLLTAFVGEKKGI